ncbi:protein qui-1-like [Centruroides vittatus]|uniref:protein qui-1-like n=1 Tax=Centruroides vittatus TaxID=120091 RepID=UPI00350F4E47
MAYSPLYQDDLLQPILHGNVTSVPDPPSKLLKIYLASIKSEFEQERRHLHDVVLPELQRHCTANGIDVELLDCQQGNDVDSTLDPNLFHQELQEIEECHRLSFGCFFLCLVGSKYKPYPLPKSVEATEYSAIYEAAAEAGLDTSTLDQWYAVNNNIVPAAYVLQSIHSKYKKWSVRRSYNCNRIQQDSDVRGWIDEQKQLSTIFRYGARIAKDEERISEEVYRKYSLSGVHAQLLHALKLSNTAQHRILCIVRQFEDLQDDNSEEESFNGLQSLIDDIVISVNRRNTHYFSVNAQDRFINPEKEEHARYLEKFGEVIVNCLKTMIDETTAITPNWDTFPPHVRKAVQEVVRESQTHLCNSRRYLKVLGVSQSLDSDYGPLLQIQQLVLGEEERLRHTPIIIYGKEGCGKSTLLSRVFMYTTEWIGSDVVRIIRHVGHSPCSTFTPELLRNLCLHISLVFGFEITPHHYSYELGKLSIWFQDLLKMVETTTSDLIIVLDDLHELRSATNNQAAILGWLPWNLPSNVHIVCSVAEESSNVLSLLKSRLSSADAYVYLSSLSTTSASSMLQSNLKDDRYALTPEQWKEVKRRLPEHFICPLYVKLLSHQAKKWTSWKDIQDSDVPQTLEQLTFSILKDIEDKHGTVPVRKIACYLTCTNFGLRELEILELLSSLEYQGPPCSNYEDNRKADFSSTVWLGIKNDMRVLLKEYYVDNRPYFHWSHRSITNGVKQRYLSDPENARMCHVDLSSAFHLGYLMQKEEKVKTSGNVLVLEDSMKLKKKDDWSDMLREVDELWIHLLLSGDYQKLKTDAICNFDFLLSAVKGASISYVRSLLEIVRCKFLDWEVEVLYQMTKLSVDVLSQDPQQLATEILNWIKPFSDGTSEILNKLVENALNWCNNYTSQLLIPLTNWLNLVLPPQATILNCPKQITHMVTTPDSQYIICSTQENSLQMYHLASKNDVRSFDGHKDTINCMYMSVSGRLFASGSKDFDVIIWETSSGKIKHRLNHHASEVLSVTINHAETIVISGSETGVVIVAKLTTGEVIRRMECHKGAVTCISFNSEDDIFATGSYDRTICVWSLDDFLLLNTINISSSVSKMNISSDSTFLLVACTDNTVHVKSLTTGSDIHCLVGYSDSVTSLCFARDNCRCVIGCSNGKCYVFDIHSAQLLQTLSAHVDPVTDILSQDQDRFLITAGGCKVVVWNFYRKTDMGPKPKSRKLKNHREAITCLAVSRDGCMAVTGSRDGLVNIWQLCTSELHNSLQGHAGAITCVAFAPNGLFAVSSAEDLTLRVWGLTLGLVVSTFKEHQYKIIAVAVTSDSRRVLSVDIQGNHRVWQADSGVQLMMANKAHNQVTLHANMVFAIGGKNDNSLRFWPVTDMDSEKAVSHSDVILCYTVTYDCQTTVTGSQDMSLKVWEVATAKLTQVLVGHEQPVTCVAVAPYSPSLVVSGSMDCNLIVWDMNTGNDTFTLRGHREGVKSVKLTLDGNVAISGSDDNTIQLWNVQTGLRIAMLDMHMSFVNMVTPLNISHLVMQLTNNQLLSILRLHNNPSKGLILDLPPGTPVTEEAKTPSHSWRGVVPKRVLLRGNLKREQSFDSFYWDMRSASPKHDIAASLEDFRRVPSPFGSREHLHLAGTVWDGSIGRRNVPLGEGLALQPKPKLPKHKILKKQQSMFACFPEYTQHQLPPQLLSPQALSKEVDRKLDFLPRSQRLTHAESLSRTGSIEEPPEFNSGEGDGYAVRQSAVCSIV